MARDPKRLRFAPSPSGTLHVGGARTALYNWLLARQSNGVFVLRIEDTDRQRSTPESIAAILSALRWLGLDWDEGPEVGGSQGPYFQSERLELYRSRAFELLAAERAYRCFCTAAELAERRRAAQASGAPPGYDGRCGRLSGADASRRGQSEPFALRFRVPAGTTRWQDGVKGEVTFDNAHLEDLIILRSDGHAAYNFAVVVDDAGMQITDVVRGDDHISNTPKQILLFEALGQPLLHYAHVPLILGPDGSRLSKRHGATSVEAFRDQGILPDAMVNHLALLGWSLDGESTFLPRAKLVEHFSMERISPSAAVFDAGRLEHLNTLHLRALPPVERRRLVAAELHAQRMWPATPDSSQEEWLDRLIEALGDRLKTPSAVLEVAGFLFQDAVEVEPKALKQARAIGSLGEILDGAAGVLEEIEPFDAESLEPALRQLAERLTVKPGAVFSALRVALTGRRAAPGIFDCLELLGRPRTLERIAAFKRDFVAADPAV